MIGIDIVSIGRFENFYKRFKSKSLSRFLSSKEIKMGKKTDSYAGYWAAKEAAAKAIGTGIGMECRFKDIKIIKLPSGQPTLKYKKKIRKKFAIKKSHLSISHDNGFAIAVVINEIYK